MKISNLSYILQNLQHSCYYCVSDEKQDSKQYSHYFLLLTAIFTFHVTLQAIGVRHISSYVTDFLLHIMFFNRIKLEVIFEGIF